MKIIYTEKYDAIIASNPCIYFYERHVQAIYLPSSCNTRVISPTALLSMKHLAMLPIINFGIMPKYINFLLI